MEFKNFEDKLIIEKLTNYCIENNISVNEINALTAKIKFGRLDEANSWFGNTLAYMGTGTATQKYNKAINDVSKALYRTGYYVDDALLHLTGPENIFKKYNVQLPEDKKQDLINAVTQLKTAIFQYMPDVKTSLQNVGGSVSGMSNYDDGSPINFDILFPELKNNADLDIQWKANYPKALPELNKIKSEIKKNILASLKDKDPSQINTLVQKFKQSIDISIENLKKAVGDASNPPNPKLAQQAYAELLSLSQGRFPATSTGTTPPPTITPKMKKDKLEAILDFTSNLKPEVENVIKTTPALQNIALKLMEDIILKYGNKMTREIGDAWVEAVNQNPKVIEGNADTQYEKNARQILSIFRTNLGL